MGDYTGCFVLVSNAAKSSVLAGAAPFGGLSSETTGATASAAPFSPATSAAALALRPTAIFTTIRRTADGWVEFADALLAARAG
jgi:hypothetical protein